MPDRLYGEKWLTEKLEIRNKSRSFSMAKVQKISIQNDVDGTVHRNPPSHQNTTESFAAEAEFTSLSFQSG
jgi:hypothetical protein